MRWRTSGRLAPAAQDAEGVVRHDAWMFTDYPGDWMSGFRRKHPMLGALTSGLVLLLFGVVVVEAWIRRQEQRQWKRVASVAFRDLASEVFRTERILDQLLDKSRFPGRVARIDGPTADELANFFDRHGFQSHEAGTLLPLVLQEPEWVLLARKVMIDRTHQLRTVVARWAPVMLATDALSHVLQDFDKCIVGLRELSEPLWNAVGADPGRRDVPLVVKLSSDAIKSEDWDALRESLEIFRLRVERYANEAVGSVVTE